MSWEILVQISKFFLILVCSISAGFYAYNSPDNIEGAVRTTVSALSIIFALSTVVSSMLLAYAKTPQTSSNDPNLAELQRAKAIQDDGRTLSRQKALYVISIISIILGIVFLVAFKDSPCGGFTRCVAFAFATCATLSLLCTIFLPSLIADLFRRNLYLDGRNK